MFRDHCRGHLAQGDVFRDLQIIEVGDGEPSRRTVSAVLLSHDCDVQPGQKTRNEHAVVIELRPSSDAAEGGLWGLIRRGDPWSTLYVPGLEPDVAEGFLDFNRIHRVERKQLEDAYSDGRRVASMSDEGREQMVYALASLLLHENLVPPSTEAL